ncbi:hypothetical protein CCYA_CCYA04G1438 [Cyanidiococcus yangmingshanensis]|nr:hypothetical protein CCYA_CCYA04G1438 [Cyanidiococcus yangmingshanensis]
MIHSRFWVSAIWLALLLSLAVTSPKRVVATPAPVSAVSWTWIGGETGINNPGNYGTLNVTSAGSVPGGRAYPAGWVGSSGLVYLFGGLGLGNASSSGNLNDLWYFNTSSLEWTWIGGNSTADQPGVYGTFREGSPTNIPGGRYITAFWQTDAQHFWLFGGLGDDKNGNFGSLNDVWLYDTTSGNWTWVAGNDTINVAPFYGPKGIYGPNYNPGARLSPAFWTGSDGLLWLFGGQNINFEYLSDLWSFNTSSFEWAYMDGSTMLNQPGNYSAPGVVNASNAPGARKGASTWTDSEGNFWLFGGDGYGNSTDQFGYLNDLWVYNTSLSAWIFIAGNVTSDNPGVYGTFGELSPANYPGGRDYAASFVDVLGNLQLFGGEGYANSTNSSGYLNDLWVFDIGLHQWAWINGSTQANAIADYGVFNVSSPSVVPGARYGSVLWNTNRNDPIVFGGFGLSNSSTTAPGYLNDVFALAEVLPTPTPTPTATPTVTATTTITATASPTSTATATHSTTITPTPTPICTNEVCGSPGQYNNQDACQQVGCCFNPTTNECTLKSVSAACSAVSVSQRVPCGWSYIYPDECIAIPGCCWQPTANGILAPWCYYDINHAPQASVALQEVQAPVPKCPSPVSQRQPCGNAGINQFTCYAQGCCYDSQVQNQWVQSGKQPSEFATDPYCFQPEKTCVVPEFERQPCNSVPQQQQQQQQQQQNNNQLVRLLHSILYGDDKLTGRTSTYTPQQCLDAGCCLGFGGECYQRVTEYVCQTYGYVSNSLSGMNSNTSNATYIACGPECCNAETQNCTYSPFSSSNNNNVVQQQQSQVVLPSFCVCKDPTKQCGTYLIPSDNLVNKVRCCRSNEECINNECVVVSPIQTPTPTPTPTVSPIVSATTSASATTLATTV